MIMCICTCTQYRAVSLRFPPAQLPPVGQSRNVMISCRYFYRVKARNRTANSIVAVLPRPFRRNTTCRAVHNTIAPSENQKVDRGYRRIGRERIPVLSVPGLSSWLTGQPF